MYNYRYEIYNYYIYIYNYNYIYIYIYICMEISNKYISTETFQNFSSVCLQNLFISVLTIIYIQNAYKKKQRFVTTSFVFRIYYRSFVFIFIFYCDAKRSNNLQRSIHIFCSLCKIKFVLTFKQSRSNIILKL